MNLYQIPDAQIGYKNFRGEPTSNNPAGGHRVFSVVLTEEAAEELKAIGAPVKEYEKEDGSVKPVLYITVRFDKFPPNMFVLTKTSKTVVTEDNINLLNLDFVQFEHVDLTINLRYWERNGTKGIKPYLTTGYFIIKESSNPDPYAGKYSNWGQLDEDEEMTPF